MERVVVRIDSQVDDEAGPARGTQAEDPGGETATVLVMSAEPDEGSGQPGCTGVVDGWFFLGW